MSFRVIDKETGKYPDIEGIVLTEDWAEELSYCLIKGFALTEDDDLILVEEGGNFVECPEGRFDVIVGE